jgi:hypothetical protein
MDSWWNGVAASADDTAGTLPVSLSMSSFKTESISFLDQRPFEGKARTSWIKGGEIHIDQQADNENEHMLGDIMTADNHIMQIKGWGGGMHPLDYRVEPTKEGETGLAKGFLDMVRELIDPYLPKKAVWIQWDGDKLTTGKFGYFLIAVAVILSEEELLNGLICMKLTSPEKMMADDGYGFGRDFMHNKGGALLRNMCPEALICLVAYPHENDPYVKKMQKDSGYGWYGASLNRLFKGRKTIFAFGGGDVLDSEEAYGYDSNTTIIGFDFSRKGGVQTSDFAKRHHRVLTR